MIALPIPAGIHSDVATLNERINASADSLSEEGGSVDSERWPGRTGWLNDVQRSADEVLDQLRSESTSDATTFALQKALQAQALELLEARLAPFIQDRAGSFVPPERPVEGELLHALCQRAAQSDLNATRQRLTEGICLTANSWRQTLSKASAGDIAELQAVLASSTAQETEADACFAERVENIRRLYPQPVRNRAVGGDVGRVENALGLRPAKELRMDVDRLVISLKPLLEQSLRKFNLTAQEHEAEGLQLLQRAAVILLDHGLDTPEKVGAFLDEARSHDDWLAFLTGALAQIGYPIGMAAFLWGIAPTLIPTLLAGSAGIPGAIAFGTVAGAMIGYFDSVAGGGASAVRDAWRYEGSAPSTSPLTEKLQRSQGRDIGIRMGISAAATFTKNALLRGVVPSIVYATAFPSGINRAIRDHVDFACDAGGGFFSGGAANVLVRRSLNDRSSADLKLLAQENLLEVIQRAQGKGGCLRGLPRTAAAYAAGLGCSALAPSTFAVTAGVMTPLVALLMGINIGMVPGLGLSQSAAGPAGETPGGAWAGNDTTPGASVSAEMPMLVAEHALKSTVSTLLMAVLAGGATGVGQWVGRRSDADCLAAVFGAVRHAAERLRERVCPQQARAAVELTGLRRRANSDRPGRVME